MTSKIEDSTDELQSLQQVIELVDSQLGTLPTKEANQKSILERYRLGLCYLKSRKLGDGQSDQLRQDLTDSSPQLLKLMDSLVLNPAS